MRKFIDIVETIADDHGLNAVIDQKVGKLSSDLQPMVIDGLDIIKRAGNGIVAREWIRSMLSLGYGPTATDLAPVMKLILREFDFCVKRSQDGIYSWSDSVTGKDDEEMDPLLKAAATQQIELSYAVMAYIRERKTFTEHDILAFLAARGIPAQLGSMFFDQVIRGLIGHAVTKQGDVYTYAEDKPKTSGDHVSAMLQGLKRTES